MIAILLPLTVIGLTAVGVKKLNERDEPELTPERKLIFDMTMTQKGVPSEKIRKVADAFEKEGFVWEATMLRKRAKLVDLPKEIKDQRRDIVRRLLESKDVAKIRTMADKFENEGATVAAFRLREYARGIEAARKASTTVQKPDDTKAA